MCTNNVQRAADLLISVTRNEQTDSGKDRFAAKVGKYSGWNERVGRIRPNGVAAFEAAPFRLRAAPPDRAVLFAWLGWRSYFVFENYVGHQVLNQGDDLSALDHDP